MSTEVWGRNEFNKDEEFKTAEMLKVLRRGRRPDRLGCSHSRISHVIESAVVCSELELMAAHQSTRCVPDLDSVSLQLKNICIRLM